MELSEDHRFYNGRHYTTAAAVRKVERLRAADESVDALIEVLTTTLSPETSLQQAMAAKSKRRHRIVKVLSERVLNACGESLGSGYGYG